MKVHNHSTVPQSLQISADLVSHTFPGCYKTSIAIHCNLQTSVSKAHFRHLGRKFYDPCSCRLPSQRPVFDIWDGSFMIRALADFRPKGTFSTFGTEVL